MNSNLDFRRNLKQLIRLTVEGKGFRIGGIAALIVLNGLANFGLVWTSKIFFDGKDGGRFAVLGTWVPLMILGLIVGVAVSNFLIRIGSLSLGEHLMVRMRSRLMERLLSAPYAVFFMNPSGILSSRLTHDLDYIKNGVIRTIQNLMRDPFLLMVLTVTIFSIDWRLAVLLLICNLILIPPVVKIARATRKLNREMLDSLGEMTSFQRDSIDAARTVKAYGAIEGVVRRYEETNQVLKRKFLHGVTIANLTPMVVSIGSGIAFLAVVLLGLKRIETASLTPGGLAAFISSLFLFYQPVSSLAGFFNDIHRALGAADNVFRLMQIETEYLPNENIEATFHDILSVNRLSFHYPDRGKTVTDLTFSVFPGSSIAIIGPNGSGKSTLVLLLMRLLTPHRGEIRLDGIDIRRTHLDSYRNLFGFVSAEDHFFDDSILNNVTLFNPISPNSEVLEVLQDVGLGGLLSEHRENLGLRIGEKGIQLSRGQRQKLSLARALLRRPKILILDEATHSLDVESIKLLNETAEKWLGRFTLILITHQIHTLESFDDIIVLDNGRIVERGSHALLIGRKGAYEKLYRQHRANMIECRLA